MLFWQNDLKYVWKDNGEVFKPRNTEPAVKHSGGSIMFWVDWIGWNNEEGGLALNCSTSRQINGYKLGHYRDVPKLTLKLSL